MRALIVSTLLALGGCAAADASPSAQEGARKPFFPVATGPSVAMCAKAAQAFDTARTMEQARAVDVACQEEMNRSSLSDACREYATAIWVAAGKFESAMEADAGRGMILQDVMESHKARAREAAPRCV